MKSWPEWLELWKGAIAEFGSVAPPPLPSSGLRAEWEKRFDEWELQTRAAADHACIYWVDNESWPPMKDDTRWFVLLRLFTAAEVSLAVIPSSNGIPPIILAPHMDERAASVWLLTEAWVTGRDRFKERICGIANPPTRELRSGKN